MMMNRALIVMYHHLLLFYLCIHLIFLCIHLSIFIDPFRGSGGVLLHTGECIMLTTLIITVIYTSQSYIPHTVIYTHHLILSCHVSSIYLLLSCAMLSPPVHSIGDSPGPSQQGLRGERGLRRHQLHVRDTEQRIRSALRPVGSL